MRKTHPGYQNLFLSLLFAFSFCDGFAQAGKDGAKIIATDSVIVNEYTYLTTNASAGSSSLAVANSAINLHNRFAGQLSQGDLILIIQMQGASINGTATDSTWGSITNYNNCGLYEFAEVASAPNSVTITIKCPLKNNYTASGKVQVVRVPRYTTLTINSAGVLTGDSWNGTQGGIVVTEVQNNTTINSGGAVYVNGLGFRGGVYVNNTAGPQTTYIFSSTDITQGGEQGESVAGFETDYNAYGGRYCRGAPANGGGGGDSWNSAGGGGANAGNINAYTGNGNPDITTDTTWKSAWNLEYNGFAYSTSSGGGRGGYNVAYSGQNPLTLGPDQSGWGPYSRANTGGKGGRPLDYSTGRIFFGGGGGACKADNSNGTSGGNGGGMVYLLSYGTVSGTGVITANGNTALDANCGTGNGDPPGGGGGGGTVIVNSTGLVSSIAIHANGGNGGNQIINNGYQESEGAGAGGGGGYIAISNGVVTRQALGGVNGTTNSAPMANFPPDGATKGGDGLANETIGAISFSSVTSGPVTSITVCSGDTVQLSAPGGSGYSWSPDTGLSCTTCANPVANPVLSTIYTVTVSNGSCATVDSVVLTVLPGINTGVLSGIPDTLCAGESSQLRVNGTAGNIQWQVSSSPGSFTNITGADSTVYITPSLSLSTDFRIIVSNGICVDTSPTFIILVNPLPAVPLSDPDSLICASDSARISAPDSYASYLWNTGDSSYYIYATTAGGYWVSVSDVNGCTATSGHANINVYPVPSVAITVQGDTLSSFDAVSYQWYKNGEKIPGATSSVYVAPESGNYSVLITDTNGCQTLSNSVNVTHSGISNLSKGRPLFLFPDPASSEIFISTRDNIQSGEIWVINTVGQEVKQLSLSQVLNGKIEMDISELPAGVYEVMLAAENNLFTAKFVKE